MNVLAMSSVVVTVKVEVDQKLYGCDIPIWHKGVTMPSDKIRLEMSQIRVLYG